MATPVCSCEECVTARTDSEAVERAEGLLTSYLLPRQAEDWQENRAFNVRGSAGRLWRLTDLEPFTTHRAVVRQDKVGISVWPIGLAIAADRMLALTLYLQSDENLVYISGCRDYLTAGPLEVYGDYGGLI